MPEACPQVLAWTGHSPLPPPGMPIAIGFTGASDPSSLDLAVVYDNVRGASDDVDAASPQALGGGSIVIHN